MKILNRYLAQEIFNSSLLIAMGLLAMFSFFDLIQQLDDIGKGSYGLATALIYVSLSAPGHIYEVIPVAVLLGALYTMSLLGRHSELVILRVSGVSMARLALVLLRVGLMFTLITFLVGELLTPLCEKTAQRMRLQATEKVFAQDFRSGLWVKDSNSFVNVEEVLPDTQLLNIHIYEFGPNFHLRVVTNAKSGVFSDGRWELKDVAQTSFAENKIRTQLFPEAQWRSVIRPELLSVLLTVPDKMAAWNLYFYIRHLSENHQKVTRQQIALWSKMIYPVASLVMVILALPFGFLQQRSGGVSAKIFAGIMLGILYQVLNKVFIHLGLLNDWPPLFSAIFPTLLFLSAGIGMLIWVERR